VANIPAAKPRGNRDGLIYCAVMRGVGQGTVVDLARSVDQNRTRVGEVVLRIGNVRRSDRLFPRTFAGRFFELPDRLRGFGGSGEPGGEHELDLSLGAHFPHLDRDPSQFG
jgi:hypothetical protein